MLGAVVFIHPPDIAQQRNSPDEEQENSNTDDTIHQVKDDLLAEDGVHSFQFRGGKQRQELVHENEESDREEDIHSCHPAADFELLFARFLKLELIKCDIGREL